MYLIFKNIIISTRPFQWIKNLLIFAPLVFALELFVFSKVLLALFIFILFCLLASAVYIINDIIDQKKDLLHSVKRLRPIASGRLKISYALFAAVLFLFISFLGSYLINQKLLFIFLIYFILNILYSLYFKQIVILDSFIVSAGFILRIYAGAVPFSILVNYWILISVFLLSLFLFFVKRRQELDILKEVSGGQRKSLNGYSIILINQLTNILAATVLICYTLWTVSPEAIEKFGTRSLFYTVPFVFFGIFRYLYLCQANRNLPSISPLDFIFKDKLMLFDILIWFLVIVFIIYF